MNLDLYFILMFSDLEMIDYVYVLLIIAFKILNKIFLEMYYRSCINPFFFFFLIFSCPPLSPARPVPTPGLKPSAQRGILPVP